MVGFEYCGNTTETIIGVPLILVSSEGLQSLENNRNKIEGEQSMSRQITNEYGTINEPLQFTYSLIKSNFESFTIEEQRIIQRWLTSPKISSTLIITNCEGEQYSYRGLFLQTTWQFANDDLSILTFTFQTNQSYPYRHFEFNGSSGHYDDEGNLVSIDDSFIMNIYCDSDELQEYIYPIIEVTALNKDENSSFILTNQTDNYNMMEVKTKRLTTMYIDCEHCIIGDYGKGVSHNIKINLLRFRDIGWDDVGNIYWPRLNPGENVFQIEGHVNVKISFDAPYKIVGGWLI